MELSQIKETVNNYLIPTRLKAEIEGQLLFLELANLKLGDEVVCYFTSYHGNSKSSYQTRGSKPGIITEMPDGSIKVKSKHELTESKEASNGHRNSRTWWEYYPKFMFSDLEDISEI